MKKVWIDPGCTTCGLCQELSPEVFEVKDISRIKKGADLKKFKEQIKEAALMCPVNVIKFEEDEINASFTHNNKS